MKKKPKTVRKTRKKKTPAAPSPGFSELKDEMYRYERDMNYEVRYAHKHLDKLWEHVAVTNPRIAHLEAQVNLLSRLLTTVCIEKFGMRLKTFRKLIRRIENEAIADSEVSDLEDLFEQGSNDFPE